jgi:hypothetical protein
MNTAGRLGILAHARCLQDDLIERVVLAAGLRLDRLTGHCVGRSSDLRLDRDARRFEPRCHDV